LGANVAVVKSSNSSNSFHCGVSIGTVLATPSRVGARDWSGTDKVSAVRHTSDPKCGWNDVGGTDESDFLSPAKRR
jgi:hypothetical protein